MNSLARNLQDIYYRQFNGIISFLGGINHASRSYALAQLFGEIRTRFGYIGRGWSREKYLSTIQTLLPGISNLEAEELLKAYWINHQKRFIELFLVRSLTPDNLSSLVSFEGDDQLNSALERGKGVILPVPHLGNERLHHISLAVRGFPMAVISSQYEDHGPYARKIKIEASRQFHEVGHPGDVKWLLRMLKQNRVLQVACDAEADANGVLVRFLGQQVLLPSGWVRLAQMTGAAIFPSALLRQNDNKHKLVILPEFELIENGSRKDSLEENVQRYMDTVSELYLNRPDQIDWMSWTVRLEETRERIGSN